MKTSLPLFALFVTALFIIGPSSPAHGAEVIPDDRDRQVLETLAIHLLADKEFTAGFGAKDGTTLVLHPKSPEKTGLIQEGQIKSDIGRLTLSEELRAALWERNAARDKEAKPHEAVRASYVKLKFTDERIILAEVKQSMPDRIRFNDTFPTARGFLHAYLPGYSADGSEAFVRAGTGPASHGAMLSAVLTKKEDGMWRVRWYHIAWYV